MTFELFLPEKKSVTTMYTIYIDNTGVLSLDVALRYAIFSFIEIKI